MKILVTGSNGQLGRELQELATEYADWDFRFSDIDTLDICDETAVRNTMQEYRPDVVVNCAAFTAVDAAEDQRELCHRLNAAAPGFLAKTANLTGSKLIQISTDYVFDGQTWTPYREEDTPNPTSVYGQTKLEGEIQAMNFCTNTMIIRTAWLYAPYGKNFVATMLRLGKEKKEIGVVFDQIGTPTYARDLARTILTVIRKGIVPGIYHYSNEGVCSWYDFARYIHTLAGIETCQVKPLHTEEYPTRASRPHYSVLDKTKIKQTYQIEIPHWSESLSDCIQRMNPTF